MSDTAYSGAHETAQIHHEFPDDIPQDLILFWPSGRPRGPERMADIIRIVSEIHGVPVSEIKGDRKTKQVSLARHEFVWRARQIKNLDGSARHSLPAIGRFLGGRDHTTALHSERKFKALLGIN